MAGRFRAAGRVGRQAAVPGYEARQSSPGQITPETMSLAAEPSGSVAWPRPPTESRAATIHTVGPIQM
jgi:hypothetical protein